MPPPALPFAPRRAFSTTPSAAKMTRARQLMFQWLNSREGQDLAHPPRPGPRYLGPFADQPFPLNPLFRSQPVLDDRTRELIWDKVVRRGQPLKVVSAEMGADVRRVAAVVRLKEVERQWEKEGKKLATPYALAVMDMLPKTSITEDAPSPAHEPVNEVHVHKLTMQQLFVPVAESRRFTRADAAAAFHSSMKPVDTRSPQAQLITMERALLDGAKREEGLAAFRASARAEEEMVAKRIADERAAEEARTTRVRTERYEFRFQKVKADDVGRDGRSRKGTGWRYGAPLEDRKRGLVKIPTSVP